MKSAMEMKHPKGTTVFVLLDDKKEYAGRIVANYSDNPSGTVCTATVQIFSKGTETGRAGGYGYDKLSAAIYQALKKLNIEPIKVRPGNGYTYEEFEAQGFTVIKAL
jgi:hypothetical protein